MSMAEFRENRSQGSPRNGKDSGPRLATNDQILSQEGAIVGNPLADLKTPDRKLSEQEETVLWANRVLENYYGLLQNGDLGRRKAKDLIFQAAQRLFERPVDIESAIGVWKSHGVAKETKNPFYESVRKECYSLTKARWEGVSASRLAQVVKTYANSTIAKDFAQDMLKGYFNGPSSKKQRINARYNFAFASLELIDDQKSLNEAIRIALFGSSILPRDSLHAQESICLNTLPWNIDNKSLQKQLVSQNVTANLSWLVSGDFAYLRSGNMDFMNKDRGFQDALDKERKKAIKKLGKTRVIQIERLMVSFTSRTESDRFIANEELLRLTKSWPASLMLDEKEILNRRYIEVAGLKANFMLRNSLLKKEAMELGVGDVNFLSVPIADGFMLDICIPSSLITAKKKIVKLALNHQFPEGHMEIFDRQLHLFSASYISEILGVESKTLRPVTKFGEQTIFLTKRKSSGIEVNYHPLQALGEVGFPNLSVDVNENLAMKNQQLADEIRRTQLRFLNRRGVRVPLGMKFKDFGYAHIDFYKDADDPEKIRVGIFVGDTPYYVKLDKYLNFDFEGKRFEVPFLADSLKFVLLSLLRPILCEEKIKNPQGVEIDTEEKEVVSRMGHLRWLTGGQRFSAKALENCFSFEGKDLFTINMQRIEEYKDTPRENQETTYVKPVIEQEENLPPVVIHLPAALSF